MTTFEIRYVQWQDAANHASERLLAQATVIEYEIDTSDLDEPDPDDSAPETVRPGKLFAKGH